GEQQLEIENSQRWIFILLSGLALLSLLLFLAWKLNQQHKRALLQTESLHQAKLESLRQQEKINEYNSMLQGQEQERSRIARDLHDGLGGMLASVKLRLSAMHSGKGNASEQTTPSVGDAIRQLDDASEEL